MAITGVGGLIGRHLVDRLEGGGEVRRVVGLDVAEPAGLSPSSRLELRIADVRNAGLARHLEGCDVVVHLAFVMDQLADLGAMHAINVGGTRNVFESAEKAGVGKIVYVSAGVAYGAHPDNDFPLTEDSPLRANPDFPYAEHKLEVERWLWRWAREHDDVAVAVFRPGVVAGPDVDSPWVRQLLEFPRYIAVKGYRPPWQFSHVDDVAAALEHAVLEDIRGAYNVACEGWLSFEEMLDLTHQKPLEIPEEIAYPVADRLWRFGFAEGPPGALHYLMHPWVMSVERLLQTGWRPRHTNREALRELYENHKGYVLVRRGRRIPKRGLRLGAGLGGGLLAGLALRRLTRRGRE
ncbi:MAG: NAD-dependent epimerase/dehydratase family protein [Actinomycetota bacterium]|nr:NAD-dependent epimerase/dehydratase family protein [Actinomycetota bacterium]